MVPGRIQQKVHLGRQETLSAAFEALDCAQSNEEAVRKGREIRLQLQELYDSSEEVSELSALIQAHFQKGTLLAVRSSSNVED